MLWRGVDDKGGEDGAERCQRVVDESGISALMFSVAEEVGGGMSCDC